MTFGSNWYPYSLPIFRHCTVQDIVVMYDAEIRGELMFWRIVISVAVVEALLCVLPIEFAGAVALVRLLLGE
jgi:hypothetical protein